MRIIEMKIFYCLLVSAVFAFGVSATANAQTTIVDFEDVGASLASDSAYRGEDLAGGYSSGPIDFPTNYNATFDSWNGAAYSNRNSWTLGGTSGFEEFQFGNDTVVASPTGASGNGFNGSDTWGVMFGFAPNEARFEIEDGFQLQSLQINNTRTTAHVLENGNSAARPFGVGDSFDVIFNSIRVDVVNGVEEVTVLASSDPFNLANGTSIVRDWTLVDLVGSGVENASMIGLEFLSTDVGMFGINTPTYVAIDNLAIVAVPEPSSLIVLALGLMAVASKRKRVW
jgi:hypothetical protein